MKAKKTSRTVLAMLMVFTMLLGCGGFSALADGEVLVSAESGSTAEVPVNGDVIVTNTENLEGSDINGVQVSSLDGSSATATVTGSVKVTDAADVADTKTAGVRAVSENYNSEEKNTAIATVGEDVTVYSSAEYVTGALASSFETGSTADIDVDGAVTASGNHVAGISAVANAGGSTEVDADSVTVTGKQEATGVSASANGEGSTTDVTVSDSVTVTATADSSHATGISTHGEDASVKTGDVTVTADSTAVGVDMSYYNAGTVETGSVSADASHATGVTVFSQNATLTAEDVTAKGEELAYGITIHSQGAADDGISVTAGDVSSTASEGEAVGVALHGPGGAITVTADEITATSESNAIGLDITSGGSNTVETGGITASADYADGITIVMDESGSANVTVNGDIAAKADSSAATGIHVMGQDENDSPNAPVGQVDMTVNGNITAEGVSSAEGIRVENYGGEDTGITVSGNISAKLEDPDSGFACGIGIYVKEASVNADVSGNIASDDMGINVSQSGGNDVHVTVTGNVEGKDGILVQQYGEDGQVEIRVESDKEDQDRIADPEKGNVKGSAYGLMVNTMGEDSAALADVVVSGTLEGGKAAVRVYGHTNETNENLRLTVFEVKLNEDGHAIVAMDENGNISSDARTEEMEKDILYIIKVEQPEGATLTALKEDGSALETSHDYQVAKEGETILMKVDLAEGYKVTGAYSVDGNENLKIFEKDGQYYVEVPKGGDVYISARLEKLAAETDSGAGSGAGAAWTGSLQLVDVTFDFNGGHKLSGSTGPVVKTVPAGTWVVLLDAPRKDGAEFLGWKADKEEITVTRPGENFRAMENVTFTAMWSGEAEPAAITNTAAVTNDAGRAPIQASPLIHESTGTEAPAAAETLSATVTDEAASPEVPDVEAPAAEAATEAEAAAAEQPEETVQTAAEEETASAEAPAASYASVGDAVLNLAELLGSASPSGEGSALQAKLVVDLPNGGSLEIPVNIQLSFGTPTIIDSP